MKKTLRCALSVLLLGLTVTLSAAEKVIKIGKDAAMTAASCRKP